MAAITHIKNRPSAKATNARFILLGTDNGWKKQIQPNIGIVCKRDTDIRGALKHASNRSMWVSANSEMTDVLLREIVRSGTGQHKFNHRWGNLLTLKSPQPETVPFLRGFFDELIGESSQFEWLPLEQLAHVLSAGSKNSQDVFIGGVVDTSLGLLTLVRGNFDRIVIPLSAFRPSSSSSPDFSRFALGDYGHAIRFGDYEASASYVLYETDLDYRKRAKKKEQAEGQTFGDSLRRLRILKGVPQSGFNGISAKTIGRIERGEVSKPHGETLKTISRTLGVQADEIESF